MSYRSTLRVAVVATLVGIVAAGLGGTPTLRGGDPNAAGTEADAKVSYYRDVRPILQAHCQGCHQPAKASGGYVMTSFERMLAGGESQTAAIVPGKPQESYLLELITPVDGKADMPKGKAPLGAADVELIRRWIAQGAVDDTPPGAKQRYDMDHPPVYSRQPILTSLDFSPDGRYLAVAGFHEVLLFDAEGNERLARLVGLSERIESVRFSPDGQRLAVTGGLPGRMGEVQVWDVEKRKLLLSVPVTYDTVYGASWSPDGRLIAFGCADNSVRAIDAETGEQVLFQGAHTDWVQDTVFSVDGTHLISVSRDMTVKLTEVATQRFVDNITSITPGALKGGISTVVRHPQRDELVIGGADGVPKVYRVHRLTARRIGDDANLIRRLPGVTGRIHAVAVSADGTRIAAGSSLDGAGEVHVYSYEFDTSLPAEIRTIMSKTVGERTAEENEKLQKYYTVNVQRLFQVSLPDCAVYAVAFRPDGKYVAAGGADGQVRFIDAASGQIVKQLAPAPVSGEVPSPVQSSSDVALRPEEPTAPERLPEGAVVEALAVEPAEICLQGPFSYVQLVVTARLKGGEALDATRLVAAEFSAPVASMSPTGLVQPQADGEATLSLRLAGQQVQLPVAVSGMQSGHAADFIRDVNPVLSKLGCNAGTCHGAAQGKNGFKLSLRGYDPVFDVRALTDDLAARRINLASPDDSLMLLKPTGAVPHVGGQLTQPGAVYYRIIRNWIASGARLDLGTPRVTRIDILPRNPVVGQLRGRQQVRVVATYADGSQRDVTREAFVESGNTEIATANRHGLMTALRRGEAPILARYEGAYAATTLTVMGDRSGFVWQDPPTWGRIDELVAAKWQRMKILPSELASDAEFIRRVYLDLTGLPPTADEVRAFLADQRDTRLKRDELVDRLVGNDDFVEYWTNKWADLLQVNRKFLGVEGAAAFRNWIRQEVAANTPYDEFVRKILLAEGSNRENPAASYYKILRTPEEIMENTTHLFLAIRFNCNKCHDHPFERWTQDQYYQTAAFFARVGLKKDPASGDRQIAGTAVEGAKPLYEIVYERPDGEVSHQRTGAVVAPQFPFECRFDGASDASRRAQLAAWITSADNPYFARSYVNRLWGYLLGVGLMEPIDDIRAGNPPTNPELLDYLTRQFVDSGFDVRHVMRLICKSRTYQLSVATHPYNEDDHTNYSHALARRLPAEVLFDAIHRVTGSVSRIPGVPPGTRAAALPDSGVELPSGFLTTLGRPPRESACECERSNDLQLGSIMALVSGPTVAQALADPNNALARMVREIADDRELINELFLRVLNRPATQAEIEAGLQALSQIDADHQRLVQAMQQREAYYAPIREKLAAQREEAIAAARADLEAYEQQIAPKIAEQERRKAERTAQLEQQLRQYEATLPELLAQWEAQQSGRRPWTVLRPTDLKASNGAKLQLQEDGSIVAEAKDGPVVYTITAELDLPAITALRLEALADASLPGGGPGLSPNGNFVLTELEVKIAPKSNPQAQEALKLQNALADFNQSNYDVKTAIDGQRPAQNNGWAVAGATGRTHWATFETVQGRSFAEGTIVTITLEQRYTDKKHNLGRFRLAVSQAPRPVGLSMPQAIEDILAVPAGQRSAEQQAALLEFFRSQDEELRRRQQALADSKQPLPIDPGLKQRRDTLARVSQMVPEDPQLVQLRKDVEMSQQQLADKRLTAAQDIAWALINSPAFLFNH
jgi:WD40 repeat protein/mono/diheme cytochrome c family protein